MAAEALPRKDCYCQGPCDCAPCKVCGETWTGNAGGLCRECDLDKLFEEWLRCGCGALLINGRVGLTVHEPTCPHEETGAFDPEPTEQPFDPVADAYARGYRAGRRDERREWATDALATHSPSNTEDR